MSAASDDLRELAHDLKRKNHAAVKRREGNGGRARRERLANMLALVTFLDEQPPWRDAVRFNELTQNIEVCDPWPPRGTTPRAIRPLREPGDLLEAVMLLQGNGWPKAGKGVVWDALSCIAARNAFHPVRDYLDGLQWDGTARVHNLFRVYCNAALPEDERVPEGELSPSDRMIAYLEHTSRCFMVGGVARIMRPGCKVDTLPVAVSDEGFNKSQAFATLCPDVAWFSDDLSPDLMQRDTKESLVGKWIIELSEMPHARREVERVKAFFSRQTDRYRRAYDRSTADHPRQCVFVGTSNDLELISVTGNRRFWPFEVAAPIDLASIAADRDQLWAEAVDLYRQGSRWWLAPPIEAFAVEQQDAYLEFDAWTEHLDKWITEGGRKLFTLAEAMEGAGLWIGDARLCPKPEQNRAAACLKRLGYRRRRRRIEGQRAHWWEKTRKLSNSEKHADGGDGADSEAS